MSRLGDVRDWALGYEGWDGLMKLNAIVATGEESGIATEGGETVLNEFIDGTSEREVEFVVHVAVPWSAGADELNSEAADLMEGWADWAAGQWPDNPPEIDGAVVTGVEPVYTVPQLEGVNGDTAVYELVIDITYRTAGGSAGQQEEAEDAEEDVEEDVDEATVSEKIQEALDQIIAENAATDDGDLTPAYDLVMEWSDEEAEEFYGLTPEEFAELKALLEELYEEQMASFEESEEE